MYHVIVNPASRSGRGKKLWEEIEPELKKRTSDYEVYFSKKAGDVAEEMRRLSSLPEEKVHAIILGGDGTVNEALQGMEPLSKFVLGYIPTGSSNDLARDLKISKDTIRDLDLILDEKNSILMDVGELHYNEPELNEKYGNRRFAVSCGIGFDAAVCEEAMCSKLKDSLNKIGLGKLTYGGIGLKQVFGAPKCECKLFLDDAEEPIVFDKIFYIAGMNHKFEGGGFKFCPDAVYDDGQIDLCTVGDISPMTFIGALPKAMKGTHLGIKGIEPYRARTVRVQTGLPLWVHTDGEVCTKASDITFTLCKEQVRLIL